MKILICGNIGTGKTTLCGSLGRILNYQTIIEDFRKNPFFEESIYKDIGHFQSQLYFSTEKLFNIRKNKGKNIIVDRSPHEDLNIFSKIKLENGFISPEEFEIISYICKMNLYHPNKYDVVIYLYENSSLIKKNLKIRGGPDKEIEVKKIDELNEIYKSWFASIKHPRLFSLRCSDHNFHSLTHVRNNVAQKIIELI